MGKGGGATITISQFPALIDGLGSTYCEDGEHGRAKKKLASDGMISIDVFLQWYNNYLFGDDEDDYEELEKEEEETSSEENVPDKSRPPSTWGDTFKVAEGSWKCDVCSVRNSANQENVQLVKQHVRVWNRLDLILRKLRSLHNRLLVHLDLCLAEACQQVFRSEASLRPIPTNLLV